MPKQPLEYLKGISKKEFTEILNKNKYLIVDCFADWCGPCQKMKPIFKELAGLPEYKDIEFVTINTDNCEWIKDEYNIDSIPRFLFFENGKLIYEQIGASDKDRFNFTIKNKLLQQISNTYHDISGISKNEFDKLISNNQMAIIFIFKGGSELNDIFRPNLAINSEKYQDIYFGELNFHQTLWIREEFDIKDVEYEKFGDEEKKLPYFLIYKDNKLIMQTGPVHPEEFTSIIKGKLLNLIHVEEFPKGIAEDELQKIIKENKYVILDIYTTWCGPCKMMKPIFQDLSSEFKEIKFISTDLDECSWLGTHGKYGTDAIPTFLFFKEGEMVEKHVGGMEKEKFINIIKKKLLKN